MTDPHGKGNAEEGIDIVFIEIIELKIYYKNKIKELKG